MVNSVDYQMPAGTGTVATTLELALGTAPANFGAFTPGVAREYLATAVPRITSTAGNAALTVYDPATTNTGRLMNGTFALSQALQVFATGTHRWQHRRCRWQRRRRSRSDAGRHLGRTHHERRGEPAVPSEHHRDGDDPQRHVHQDADVHAQHHGSVGVSLMRAGSPARIFRECSH